MAVLPQVHFFHVLQRVIDGVDTREGQLRAMDVCWVVAELVSPGLWDHLPQARSGSSFPKCQGLALLQGQDQLSCAWVMVCYLWAIEGWGQFSTTLAWLNTWFNT